MVTQRPAETDHEKSTDRRELPHLRSSGHMASSLLWGPLPELHEELENARTSESDLGSNPGSSLPCDWGRGFEGSPSLGFLGPESHLGILLTQRAVIRSQLNCHCGLPSIGEAFQIDPSPFPSSSFLAIVFLCIIFGGFIILRVVSSNGRKVILSPRGIPVARATPPEEAGPRRTQWLLQALPHWEADSPPGPTAHRLSSPILSEAHVPCVLPGITVLGLP